MNIWSLLKCPLTLGKGPQSFLGAKWLVSMLRICPNSKKRSLALRILALSPHYFYKHLNPEYSKMPYNQFLEAEYIRNKNSREKICDLILSSYFEKGDRVLDYGYGPGFLAKSVSSKVQKVYAVDISRGVLECAKILNPSENIEYIYADNPGLNSIPDNSLDVVYSVAVIQHVTQEVFEQILKTCFAKLKLKGKLVFHVQLDSPDWKSEEECRADKSFVGKIKFNYFLNCFSKTTEFFFNILPKYGFEITALESIKNICEENFDDICNQHLLAAVKL